jgi:hypothetical protein
LPIHQHGAGAAGALVAAFLGPGKTQPVAQEIKQRDTRISGSGTSERLTVMGIEPPDVRRRMSCPNCACAIWCHCLSKRHSGKNSP